MGLDIDREQFGPDDHARFRARLAADLRALSQLLARPGFGEGPVTLGAELELHLVDEATLCAAPVNRQVLATALDPRFTFEIDRFNIELNASPVSIAHRPFTAIGQEIDAALADVRRAASAHRARVVMVGILPTLRERDLSSAALTDLARPHALSRALRAIRGGAPFALHIEGQDALKFEADDVVCEGANTSFQLHVRVPPRAFARAYNAAQLATPVALAAAGNSPIFLGRRLWDETRVALFKQSTDHRVMPDSDIASWRPPARVSFGHGWVREGALELFEESVALFEDLLPVCGSDEEPEARVARGEVPRLEELRLHHGTVWRWNRAVYDHHDGGHLRIELRALPAGPTTVDMLASAAFALGLTLALAPEADRLVCALPFEHAHWNFYRAAQRGLDAELLWPAERAPSPRPVRARDLALALLPRARAALVDAGVDAGEADALLGVIEARVRTGRTGARWQRAALAKLAPGGEPPDHGALRELLARYHELSVAGAPVHEWPAP